MNSMSHNAIDQAWADLDGSDRAAMTAAITDHDPALTAAEVLTAAKQAAWWECASDTALDDFHRAQGLVQDRSDFDQEAADFAAGTIIPTAAY